MNKLIRFELKKMFKDQLYIIVFLAFFLIGIYSVCISNIVEDVLSPFYSQNTLSQFYSQNTDTEYPTTGILDRYAQSLEKQTVPGIGTNKGLYSASSLSKQLTSYPLLLIIFIGAFAFSKDNRGGAMRLLATEPFSRSKILFSKYFASVFFSLIVLVTTLLGIGLFNYIFCNAPNPNTPVSIMGNYLSSSLTSKYVSEISVPLWKYEVLVSILLVLEVFAFNAIALFFSVAIKNPALSVLAALIVSGLFIYLSVKRIASPSIFNPFSLTNLSRDLHPLNLSIFSKSEPVTFMDAVISFCAYSVIFIVASGEVIKRKNLAN